MQLIKHIYTHYCREYNIIHDDNIIHDHHPSWTLRPLSLEFYEYFT